MGGMENSRKTINHHQLGHVGMTHHILQLKLSNDNASHQFQASDLEEHGNPMNMAPQSASGSRWNPTADQVTILKELYRAGMRTPTAEQIQQISSQLRRYGKIEGKNVFYWFQNHKARERQKRRRCDNNNVLQKPDSDTWITEEEESSSPQLYGHTAYARDSHNSRQLYPKEIDTSQSYRDGISKWVHGFRQEFHYNSPADNTNTSNNLNRGTHGDHGIDGSAVFRTQKGHIRVGEVGGKHEPETLQLFPVKYEGRSHEKPDCTNCSSWLHEGNNYCSSDVNGNSTNECSTKDPLDLSLSCLCE